METVIKDFINKKIESEFYSCAHVMVSQNGKMLTNIHFGTQENTFFNIESITKVMVTLPIAFKLIQDGKLNLDDKLVQYIPEFGEIDSAQKTTKQILFETNQKKQVTIRDLLNFSAGISLTDPEGSEEAAILGDLKKSWKLHYVQDLESNPGTKTLYSDVSCRLLGKALERLMGKSLDKAANEWFFEPLGMVHTMFTPFHKNNCANLGYSEFGRKLQGEICQDLEHFLGEVLGSDGLFSTSSDMTIFAQMLLNGGEYNGKRVLKKATVKQMSEGITNSSLFKVPISNLEYIVSGPKTWFWEHGKSPFSFFGNEVSDKAIGKMGGAGTFLLIDPEKDLIIVYLTNYGEPEQTLKGESSWNTFFSDIDMAGLCDLVITNLNL